jgi:DNA-binding CsgD family transcriptional regulator
MIDAIEAPAAVTNVSGTIIYCNHAYLDLMAKLAVDVIGCPAARVLPNCFLDLEIRAEKNLHQSCASQIQYELSCRSLHPFEIHAFVYKSALLDQEGAIVGYFTLIKLSERLGYTVIKHKFQLTNQEMRVFEGLIEGLSVKSIAKVLMISSHTVTGHMKVLYKKIAVKSRYELQYIGIQIQRNPLSYWRRHFSPQQPASANKVQKKARFD